MEITTRKNELSKALSRVMGAINKNAPLDILQNVKISASRQGLTLAATDLSLGIIQDAEASVKTPGALCLPARALLDIVKAAPNDEIKIKVNSELTAELSSGKSKYKIAGFSERDFPVIERPGKEVTQCNGAALAALIEKCAFAISEDDTRAHLAGAYLVVTKERATLASTDGHRCARSRYSAADTSLPLTPGVIIPRRGLLEMKRFTEANQEVFFLQSGSNVYLQSKDSCLLVKLIDGQFPDYEMVLPQKPAKHIATVNRAALADALKRAGLMAKDQNNAVAISLTRDKLEIDCVSQKNEAHEEIDADYTAKPIRFGVNVRYLMDSINATTALEIELGIDDETSPVSVCAPSDDSYISVIMPMHI